MKQKEEDVQYRAWDVNAMSVDPITGSVEGEPRVERVDTTNPLFEHCRTPWDVEDAYHAFWNRLDDRWMTRFPEGKEKVVVLSVAEAGDA